MLLNDFSLSLILIFRLDFIIFSFLLKLSHTPQHNFSCILYALMAAHGFVWWFIYKIIFIFFVYFAISYSLWWLNIKLFIYFIYWLMTYFAHTIPLLLFASAAWKKAKIAFSWKLCFSPIYRNSSNLSIQQFFFHVFSCNPRHSIQHSSINLILITKLIKTGTSFTNKYIKNVLNQFSCSVFILFSFLLHRNIIIKSCLN